MKQICGQQKEGIPNSSNGKDIFEINFKQNKGSTSADEDRSAG